MKVKYVGPVKEGYIPRVGKFIRGQVYDLPDEVALALLRGTGFRLVDPPKRVRRRRPVVRKRPKPKAEEKPEVKPKELPKKATSKKESPKEVPTWGKPKEEESSPPGEEEIKIEKETPEEV